MGREVEVTYAVEHIQRTGADRILYLGLLRILLLYGLIVYLAVDVAVVAEHVLGNRGAQLRIDPRHQYGLTTKSLGHPAGKGTVLLGILVPYTDAKREGQTVVAAAKERTVRSRGKGCLYLGLGFYMVGLHLVEGGHRLVLCSAICPLDGLQSGEELVAFRNVLGH